MSLGLLPTRKNYLLKAPFLNQNKYTRYLQSTATESNMQMHISGLLEVSYPFRQTDRGQRTFTY